MRINFSREHLTRNEQVTGSSPVVGSTKNALNDAIKADFGAFLFLAYRDVAIESQVSPPSDTVTLQYRAAEVPRIWTKATA